MSDNVIGLRDASYVPPGSPDPQLVSKLEGYLEQAKRGEIDGVAIAVSRPNGRVATDFNLGMEAATFRVVAATGLLHHDVCAAMNDVPLMNGPGDEDHSA